MKSKRNPRLDVTLPEHLLFTNSNQKLALKGEIYAQSPHQKILQQQTKTSSLNVGTILSLNIWTPKGPANNTKQRVRKHNRISYEYKKGLTLSNYHTYSNSRQNVVLNSYQLIKFNTIQPDNVTYHLSNICAFTLMQSNAKSIHCHAIPRHD